ncbi:Pectate lyase superfamily protein [Dillenia turbinata]|uniref:Pectate lyase superfamily protein n=1 Tax=Dillenia turbinata TaxID=194707 RepID=A0AAN8UK63_9MAGN
MELLSKAHVKTQVLKKVFIIIYVVVGLVGLRGTECRKLRNSETLEYTAINCRAHSASIVDFGGVGDGKTSNTKAFQEAVNQLSRYANDGGAQLYVPAGKWLTGSFNLTSHFTLYIHNEAVLLASQDLAEWPVIPALPSYGRGRDAAAGRYASLIWGTNLTDVVITDSCTNTRIEDCYIVSGDDCVAVKSGWDEYGIAFGMPTKQLVIRRLTCISPYSATIALGSEMSGGIQDVRAEDITAVHTESGVRIKQPEEEEDMSRMQLVG